MITPRGPRARPKKPPTKAEFFWLPIEAPATIDTIQTNKKNMVPFLFPVCKTDNGKCTSSVFTELLECLFEHSINMLGRVLMIKRGQDRGGEYLSFSV